MDSSSYSCAIISIFDDGDLFQRIPTILLVMAGMFFMLGKLLSDLMIRFFFDQKKNL